ncbi:hypothetical protein SAMN05519103_01946 [Rhizobiales bacterium GAS113]|nr:hypothetical protein SAMN05519103_01946 [Rhizobiales bacterium GAS113]
MPSNGSNGGSSAADASPRPTFEEALAAMPSRTPADQLARFTTMQCDALRRMIEAQSTAMFALVELMGERCRLLESEIMRLKAEQGDSADKPNGARRRQ